jgi:hypothetical protein
VQVTGHTKRNGTGLFVVIEVRQKRRAKVNALFFAQPLLKLQMKVLTFYRDTSLFIQ